MGSRRFSIGAVLFTLFGAVLAFLLGELLLLVGATWPSFLRIAIYFGGGALVIALMLILAQYLNPKLVGYNWKQKYIKNSFKHLIPATFLMLGLLGGLFEFLYSLDIKHQGSGRDIIIAIDTSGSMDNTDPQGARFEAVKVMIDNLSGDKRVALVTFDDEPEMGFDFTEVKTTEQKEALKAQVDSLNISNDGRTFVGPMVETCYQLLETRSEMRAATFILVSDGSPSDSELNIHDAFADYVKEQIPVYTIAMMYSEPDMEAYLQEISNFTGGKHFSTEDTAMLEEAFDEISMLDGERGLVEARTGDLAESTLYTVMRIGFLTLISLVLALSIGIVFDNRFLAKGVMLGGTLGGLIGSILMEMLFRDGLSGYSARSSYWICLGIALLAFTWSVTFKDSYHGTRSV